MRFLVPAFVVVEADSEDNANDIAGDFCVNANQHAHKTNVLAVCYLDEELPTFKQAHGDEDEHTLVDYIKAFFKKEKQR